ncbi:ABC transporter ATP-binding protein [Thermogemmatispora sp.]|uniref:ABC transporter ATP-binding protein n=1 Tax=Thermogemmatispora sp. TaxID=1968838 RepID=UPI001DC8C801|nr:ABC transporter ATP-binding protein [Thermogemmatispora sp.]MBX5450255.1 ABC transporter ATP-binding protein [Thermogemmatispora sp.]
MSTVIHIEQLSKSFVRNDQEIAVLRNMNLDIESGSFVVIAGPSGCGKTTLLNIVAGLLPPSSGAVYYKGAPISGPRLEVGYLTQKDTLMPWRSVERNVEMPLEIRGVAAPERRRRAAEFIRLVGLAGFEKLYPHELSGGMLRRASLARMLVTMPETLLLDEPFAALDAQLRLELQNELLSLWSRQRSSVLFVTHDLEEAILLGDRVLVLGAGGRIIADEPVTLPRPRDVFHIRFRPEFTSLHRRLWDALMESRSQVQRQEVKL